ncbi:MAG TPA: hypothetical protein VIG30_12560 [Ktedonobacterales bacterium]|jgi:hypothetical protein
MLAKSINLLTVERTRFVLALAVAAAALIYLPGAQQAAADLLGLRPLPLPAAGLTGCPALPWPCP